MAFRFKRRESIAAGFSRIVAEQLALAASELETSADDGVHEARKCIKRVRSLLRLFRRALPDGTYVRENTALRATARGLSSLRDAQVLIAVFDTVVRRLKTAGLDRTRRLVLDSCQRRDAHTSSVSSAITTLRTIAARLPGLKPDSGWSVLNRGLRSTYRRARKAHAAAHAELTTASLHAWRRRSKDFEYQLQLLRKTAPAAMKARLHTASALTELLGDDHDLALLERTLLDSPNLADELRETLRTHIARRRRKLQRRAFAAGSELFFEKPSVVIKELGRQWKGWRKGA
jgi:CHAD domain-containing protein